MDIYGKFVLVYLEETIETKRMIEIIEIEIDPEIGEEVQKGNNNSCLKRLKVFYFFNIYHSDKKPTRPKI